MAPKKGATPPARTSRGDRGRDVDMSRSPCPAASEATSDIATAEAMLGIEIEIEIVYNMSRQIGPAAVSRATLLRHT
jgi:hypothetical protein